MPSFVTPLNLKSQLTLWGLELSSLHNIDLWTPKVEHL